MIYILYHFIAHAIPYCKLLLLGRRLHKLEKLVSDPYLLYLAKKNMFKLKNYRTNNLGNHLVNNYYIRQRNNNYPIVGFIRCGIDIKITKYNLLSS